MQRAVARVSEIASTTSALIPSAVIAAREELELPINEMAYRQLFEEQRRLVRITMQKLTEGMEPQQTSSE